MHNLNSPFFPHFPVIKTSTPHARNLSVAELGMMDTVRQLCYRLDCRDTDHLGELTLASTNSERSSLEDEINITSKDGASAATNTRE